jgi:hypothetical protein
MNPRGVTTATTIMTAGLNVGQPQIIGPAIGADRDRVAALVIGAVHQDATNAHVAHLGERDLLRADSSGHA